MEGGAAESVAPADMAPWVPISKSEGSRRGQTYMGACGEKLPDLGQKQIKVWTNEDKPAMATFQCDDVTRPLESSLKANKASLRASAVSVPASRERNKVSCAGDARKEAR